MVMAGAAASRAAARAARISTSRARICTHTMPCRPPLPSTNGLQNGAADLKGGGRRRGAADPPGDRRLRRPPRPRRWRLAIDCDTHVGRGAPPQYQIAQPPLLRRALFHVEELP
eukprot:scaffold16853_cov104-Isochrysis_galbana.AAC.3